MNEKTYILNVTGLRSAVSGTVAVNETWGCNRRCADGGSDGPVWIRVSWRGNKEAIVDEKKGHFMNTALQH